MEIVENVYIDWCTPSVGFLLGFEYEPLIIVEDELTKQPLAFKMYSLGFLIFRVDLLIDRKEK